MSAISGLLLAVVLGALAGALAVFLWRQARITSLQLEQQRLLDARKKRKRRR